MQTAGQGVLDPPQGPGPPQPPGPYGPRPKPAIVTVLWVTMVTLGAMGLFASVLRAFSRALFGAMARAGYSGGFLDHPSVATGGRTWILLGFLGAALLLAAGIGVSKSRPWGRVLGLTWSVYRIAQAIWELLWLPRAVAAFGAFSAAGGDSESVVAVTQDAAGVLATAAAALGLVLPIATLVVLLRRDVARCFH